MKSRVAAIGLIWLSGLTSLFAVASDAVAQNRGRIEFSTVAEGATGGLVNARDQVITSAAEWEALWNELHSDESPIPPLPDVDFTQKMIIVTALGDQGQIGHKIKITKLVSVTLGQLPWIKVNIEEARMDGPVQEITYRPYHIIETARAPRVTFRRHRVSGH